MNCELKFIAHKFSSKYFRPLDYLLKLGTNLKDIWGGKPDFVVAQCPPTFSALPALITNTPYVIDAHNPLFQLQIWQKLPLAQTIINHALAIIVHNGEMFDLVKGLYPGAKLFTIADPIQEIAPVDPPVRIKDQILVIASFDPWDEPVGLLLETMAKLPEYNFVITADINKVTPEIGAKLKALANVKLTGFLATEEYHRVLCSTL
ncbi:MAG: glycosyltransferase [Synechococcaceae cyanobacterium RL_1_2]|nr:glycosyltransferase [Synechococcaceae cyanobacterium RL_1_2]